MRDSEGIEHTAEVTADSLYEEVALGLKAIRKSSWVEDLAQNFEVRVLVRDTPVEHSIAFRKFNQWLDRPGKTPKEIVTRNLGSFDPKRIRQFHTSGSDCATL